MDDFFEFPPFFTLQPVESTRQKQLQIWHDLVVAWHEQNHSYLLTVSEWAGFSNPRLNRSLDAAGRLAVLDFVIGLGHGEWEDTSRSRFFVFGRRTLNEWSSVVYDFVRSAPFCWGDS